jgi:ABC-2 type transport system permease protein
LRGLLTIWRRELAGLFLSPLAWILFFLVLAFNGVVFLHALEGESRGNVDDALMLVLGGGLPFWILCACLAPLVTMRMISEESKSGVLELLLTAPVGDAALVLGKALAAVTFFAVLWASAPLYGLCVQALGAPPDWGMVLTSWLGATLVCALFVSVGLAASALSDTPLVAAFLAMLVDMGFFWAARLGHGARARSPVADWLLGKLDVTAVYQASFQTGALDSAHVLFFVAWSAAFLFLAVRLVESRRWL